MFREKVALSQDQEDKSTKCDEDVERQEEEEEDDLTTTSASNFLGKNTKQTNMTNPPPPPVTVHKTITNNSNNINSNDEHLLNGHKDHYSYTYSYKTAGDGLNSDGTQGMPGVSSVEVNESVTEEIGPDGSKIIRRHQQEKQVNKITQVVTQRVIKRQYIDPQTGQIIEYDPNNELFANLPPETVFEEHTVISDDNGSGNPPVITTMTSSSVSNKASPSTQKPVYNTVRVNSDHVDNVNMNNVYSTINSMSNLNTQHHHQQQQQQQQQSASFRIKSHPEDNQGYPEEKNMDYDPDPEECFPDDDSPYEGLLQPPMSLSNNNNGSGRRGHHHSKSKIHHHHHHHIHLDGKSIYLICVCVFARK